MKLDWLPKDSDWTRHLTEFERFGVSLDGAAVLARSSLNATQTNALDRAVNDRLRGAVVPPLSIPTVRLAILGSCTTTHLHAAIRVAGLRRNLWIETYEPAYGQYHSALTQASDLAEFAPTAILLTQDAHHLAAGVGPEKTQEEVEAALQATLGRLRECWRLAKAFECPIIQTIPLPLHVSLLGSNEHRLHGSRSAFIRRLSDELRRLADNDGIDLLSLDTRCAIDGLAAWYDPDLWFNAKMEVAPFAAPAFGELLTRIIASQLGLSGKCLVLDLDNTIWGGAIGDVGIEGIELGQGSAVGEAFLAVQTYALELSRRGVILAVCSKNDESNALEAFDRHPEMVLRRSDIACFKANWIDKPTNLRAIAKTLNIGLESLVLLDDNPFERALVRRELSMVSVPEVSDDPSTYPRTLEAAGYFEATIVTEEDRKRGASYLGNIERLRLSEASTDLDSYLATLESELLWRPFDRVGLARIVQLANKTNQFNLTTRRYTEADVETIIEAPKQFGLQLRLRDRFGDNGMIAVVAARLNDAGALVIENWLMSCRVLGRGVEKATLDIIIDQAARMGAVHIVGKYRPTAKNRMVEDHYSRLGFSPTKCDAKTEDDFVFYSLSIADYERSPSFIVIREELGA